jgi:hypothetical protein
MDECGDEDRLAGARHAGHADADSGIDKVAAEVPHRLSGQYGMIKEPGERIDHGVLRGRERAAFSRELEANIRNRRE